MGPNLAAIEAQKEVRSLKRAREFLGLIKMHRTVLLLLAFSLATGKDVVPGGPVTAADPVPPDSIRITALGTGKKNNRSSRCYRRATSADIVSVFRHT